MKKIRAFFIIMLVTIILLGFSGTSQAFDLSKITSKPVEFAKYIAKKLGFGDDKEKNTPETEPSKEQTIQESADSSNNTESITEPYNSDLAAVDSYMPVVRDEVSSFYGVHGYGGINLTSSSEEWNLVIDSLSSEILVPFSFKSPNIPVWQTKVKYSAKLPWESFSQINTELFFKSDFYRQQTVGLESVSPEDINETALLTPDNVGYGIRVNALVKDAEIDFYGWYGNDTNLPRAAFPFENQDVTSDSLWRAFNPDYNQVSNNLAATVSYELPFMRFFHQGISPTVRFETAYKASSNKNEYSGQTEKYDQWKVGMAYEGTNRIDWLNTYGINWGVGYNYTVTLDDQDTLDNMRKGYGSHSGNIRANTYWFNMKLYTMFMYRYDRETRGSMTVINATYSPDWRWSYGIKANIYYGKKDDEHNELNDNSELVTFTATYRWD